MPNINDIIRELTFANSGYLTFIQQRIANLLYQYNSGYLINQPLLYYLGREYITKPSAFWLLPHNYAVTDTTGNLRSGPDTKQLYPAYNVASTTITPDYTAIPDCQYDRYEQMTGYTYQHPLTYDRVPRGHF